uniref:Uncharacterized protein n=1 Tax=Lygus hesperus TaxID=30085 RepID=A0A146LGK1_LYGHE
MCGRRRLARFPLTRLHRVLSRTAHQVSATFVPSRPRVHQTSTRSTTRATTARCNPAQYPSGQSRLSNFGVGPPTTSPYPVGSGSAWAPASVWSAPGIEQTGKSTACMPPPGVWWHIGARSPPPPLVTRMPQFENPKNTSETHGAAHSPLPHPRGFLRQSEYCGLLRPQAMPLAGTLYWYQFHTAAAAALKVHPSMVQCWRMDLRRRTDYSVCCRAHRTHQHYC